MAIPVSSLSQICREVANFVATQLDATALSIRVLLGTPADAAKEDKSTQRLNLLFYRFDPLPTQASLEPGDPWQLRLFCLVTPFGVKEGLVGAGEMDLRLIGEVLRVFHEHPILPQVSIDGQPVRLHAIFQPPDMAEINNLWGTQGADLAYRPSLTYEFAVSPIVPKSPRILSPLVGSSGVAVTATLEQPAAFEGVVFDAPMTARVADTGDDWTPAICFVRGGACAQTLALAANSPELASPLNAWVAGQPGESVTLQWDIWDKTGGWRASASTTVTVSSAAIDPDSAASATLAEISLPFTDHAGQALLHAERSYKRPSDGATITLRSNLLLVTLYGAV